MWWFHVHRVVAVLLVSLMLGVVFSSAAAGGIASGAPVSENDAYAQFWNVLYREAYLVSVVNESANAGHINATAARELIDNSRAGEENAANISAQIWLALGELKKAGVKLKYSAEELRKMAEDIKKNGLPPETVKELKSQGWTDEEIKALQEYIAKNADNVTTGFDMGSFLTNFSKAFVLVGFKYASYESWALERWKWAHPEETREEALKAYGSYPKEIVPDVSEGWVSFYAAYLRDNVSGMNSSLKNIIEYMDSILMPSLYSSGTTFVSGGGVVVQNVHRVGNSLLGYSYYWPSALKAYNLTRQVYVLVETMSMGNRNPELKGLLNQKVAELKDALVVYYHDETSINPNPNPNPPHPCVGGKCLWTGTSSKGSGSLKAPSGSFNDRKDLLKKFALDVDSNYGYIVIEGVDVIPVEVTGTYATYRVVVHFRAVNNVVNDVKVKFHGSGLSYQVTVGYVHPDDGVKTVSSIVSSRIYGNGASTVSVAGTVTVTGKSVPTPRPTEGFNASAIGAGIRNVTVTEDYHKVINLKSSIDPSKVTFSVFTDPASPVLVGTNVKFKIYVYNGNSKPVSFNYRLYVQCPTSPGNSFTKTVTGSLSLGPNSGRTITVFSNTFSSTGSFGYSGTLYFGQYSKTSQGTLDVRATPVSGGSVKILGVSVSPPRWGSPLSSRSSSRTTTRRRRTWTCQSPSAAPG